MSETAQIENEIFSKRVRRMFGLSLDTWNNIMVASLGIGAGAAFIVVVSTFVIIKLQKLEATDANLAFEQYKLGVAGQVAEAKKEGIEAGKTAGNALLRAAELEKEAAVARLETEKLKEIAAWRSLPIESASELEKILAANPGSVNLRYSDSDPESLYFAIQISQILTRANWKIAPGALKLANSIVFGITLPDANGADAETLRKAFSAAKIPYSTNAFSSGMMLGFAISTIDGAPTLMVGSRMPPKLP
jgi:hypothetical protein